MRNYLLSLVLFNAATNLPSGFPKLVFQRNVLLKYGNRFQADVNILANFNRAFYGGLSFRPNDNINLMCGMMKSDIRVGYSLVLIINTLKPGTKTTHALFVQYCYTLRIKKESLLNPRHLHDSPY